MRIQRWLNVISRERRICLTRLRWERGKVGDGKGYSAKLSISLCFEPRDLWVGLFWSPSGHQEWMAWLCLLPALPIRVHFQRSYGGVFP